VQLIDIKETSENLEISFKFANQNNNSKVVLNSKTFSLVSSENIPELKLGERIMLQGFLENALRERLQISSR
jgi:hypothetical protein